MTDLVHFHYIHFINCLPPEDSGGAKRIYENLLNINAFRGPLRPEYTETPTPTEFLLVLAEIEKNITPNSIPLIHIDAHADKEYGLSFRNDNINKNEYISWDILTEYLGKINLKISNKLFLVLCACSAFYINSKLHPTLAAPFSLCISPYSELTLSEIERTIPSFYNSLIKNHDLITAVAATQESFEMVSSDIFLKEILVKTHMTTLGKAGKLRREGLLTQLINKSKTPVNKKQARRYIKERLKSFTDEDIKRYSDTYLCGRPAPFSAHDVKTEATKRVRALKT